MEPRNLDFTSIYEIIVRNWKTIAVVVVVSAIVGVVISMPMIMTPKFKSTAIVYPAVEVAQGRRPQLDEASLREMVEAEIDGLCRKLAAYKRVTRVELTDTPLPKTALRKVARGSLRESYEFDYETWLKSAEEVPG